ncbi:hypothetical protein HaLaN_26415 [Haematococcus lacustris]|uniref:Uncharacterized protein n=1 Tax=Haematococcus lacustris TaxID=44745 RepID=A0A6A0A655_HAELA|nr:hypothetical protein HaLaN_26415 [Haematococcus lacustris]
MMRGPAHRQDLRPIPKAFFADPDSAAITTKLVELDKTGSAGDGNTIGALAKQMAVNTREMFANPEDVEEAAAPGDPADSEDPDAPPPLTKLPLHRRILYAIHVNRCLEE